MKLPWVLTAGLAAVVLTATAAGLVTPPTLRRLPEPELATGEHKPLYTDLPPPPLAWGAAAWAAALALATVTSLPANKLAPFLVVALVGSVGCIIAAATIPAFMHFFGIFMQVHFEAKRHGLRGLTDAEMPRLGDSLRQRWPTLIPLALLITVLVSGRTPYLAAYIGISRSGRNMTTEGQKVTSASTAISSAPM